MLQLDRVRCLAKITALAAAGLLSACGSSGSDTAATGGSGQGFQLLSISVPEGTTDWRINAPIVFTFNQPVDVGSISGGTIAIREAGGSPALGTFSFVPTATGFDDTRVIFQPACPLLPSPFPDAGLQPGGTRYVIRVIGGDSTGPTLTSNGEALAGGQERSFSTPNSFAREDIFADTRPGPPEPVLFDGTGSELVATRLEVVNENGELEVAAFPVNAEVCTTADSMLCAAPLNLFSGQGGSATFVIEFDQPVDPSAENISSERVGLEFRRGNSGEWAQIPTEVELIGNCTETGASVRLSPVGVLPPEATLRLFLSADFSDLRGQTNGLLSLADFAFAQTRSSGTPGFVPEAGTGDSIFEDFAFSGSELGSREDVETAIALPRAEWGSTELRASFDFQGSGGAGGDFDYTIRAGEDVFFETTTFTITNAQQTRTQNVIGGVLDVRNLTIEEGGRLRVFGPNPLVIFATGEVIIDGLIDASGFAANDVQSLLLANVPQPGGSGLARGGNGGDGSPNTLSSTALGEAGFGAFQVAGVGGQGGESGYTAAGGEGLNAPVPQQRAHQSGGGGGAAFAQTPPNVSPELSVEGDRLLAQPGFAGIDSEEENFPVTFDAPGAFGAVTNELEPFGGAAGRSPFLDGTLLNNFFGTRFLPDVDGGGLLTGELPSLWYGSGGGGGGDSISQPQFPSNNFVPGNTVDDRKGGAGGGGGGALHILSIGDISFGPLGRIVVEGGDGGNAQNYPFNNNRPGGGGGGGSGGHVLLETNSRLDLSRATGEVVSTRGGLGAESTICEDAIVCVDSIFLFLGRLVSNGGAGGAGVIQVHLPGSNYERQLDAIDFPDPRLGLKLETLDDVMVPSPIVAVPTFASRSMGLSEWIPMGGASAASGGAGDDLAFFFSQVLDATVDPNDDTIAGRIQTDGNGAVLDEPALLAGSLADATVDVENGIVSIASGSLLGTPDDLYLRNPALLDRFGFELSEGFNTVTLVVAGASFDQESGDLQLTLQDDGGTLAIFSDAAAYELQPRFFRVRSQVGPSDVFDVIPDGARVSVQLQATGLDPLGEPDDENPLVDWTGDPEDLNDPSLTGTNAPAFVRFRVIFDISEGGSELTASSPRPALEFLRLPFRF